MIEIYGDRNYVDLIQPHNVSHVHRNEDFSFINMNNGRYIKTEMDFNELKEAIPELVEIKGMTDDSLVLINPNHVSNAFSEFEGEVIEIKMSNSSKLLTCEDPDSLKEKVVL